MGGSSGKLAKVLSGNASKDFLVSTFKRYVEKERK